MNLKSEYIDELEGYGYSMLKKRGYSLPFKKITTGNTIHLSLTKANANDGIIVHPGYEKSIPFFEKIPGVQFRPGQDNYFHIETFYEYPKRIKSNLPVHYGLEFTADSAESFSQFLYALDQKPCEPNQTLELANFEEQFSQEPETERSALRSARIGQGPWRKKLDLRWEKCALTGCNIRSLLRGSHIKPWVDGTNKERLDPENGLLLRVDVDALFDDGLITFSNAGKISFSEFLSPSDLSMIPFDAALTITGLSDGNKKFLAHHRTEVFRDAV